MTDDDPRDQRRRRSEETQQAIIYQLEHVLQEFDMRLLILADAQGLLIAHAGDDDAATYFAAHAPSLVTDANPHEELQEVLPDLARHNILCESISLDNIPLYLGAVMDPTPEHARAFERVRTGIQRIYYSTSELADDP